MGADAPFALLAGTLLREKKISNQVYELLHGLRKIYNISTEIKGSAFEINAVKEYGEIVQICKSLIPQITKPEKAEDVKFSRYDKFKGKQ